MGLARIEEKIGTRNHWPKWLNALIDYVADNPLSVLGKIAALRYRPCGALPPVTEVSSNVFSVAIGPVNYSNQATLWAWALQENFSEVSAASFAVDVPGGFDFPSNLRVPVDFYQRSRKWQRLQAKSLSQLTHLLVEAEEPLLGRFLGRSPIRELEYFSERGVNIAYVAHGTDVRIPSRHILRTDWSPYRDADFYVDRLEKSARRNVEFLSHVESPVFVSTPDLVFDVPSARWCPVVVDMRLWVGADNAEREPGRLRVIHVPSVQRMKGTQLIEPLLHELHCRGLIEYRSLGGVPSTQMPDSIAWADVVLDQFRLGSYGVAACEAMASGKAVIGHVLNDVRQYVHATTGSELPILEANPNTIEGVLRELASSAEMMRSVQRAGYDFVSHVHSGKFSAHALMDNWIAPIVRFSRDLSS